MIINFTFNTLLTGILVTLLAVVVHELGHILYLKRLGRSVTLRLVRQQDSYSFKVGLPEDYEGLSLFNLRTLYVSGVIAGLVVIILAAFFNPAYILILPPYLVGCYPDLKKIYLLLYSKNCKKGDTHTENSTPR